MKHEFYIETIDMTDTSGKVDRGKFHYIPGKPLDGFLMKLKKVGRHIVYLMDCHTGEEVINNRKTVVAADS
jgi:hypothetical protein